MNVRERIRMSPQELAVFLAEERTVVCGTIGRGGFPHLMPLWYVVRDGELWAWTYAASQKVRNLERDPRATLLVEAGEVYERLRGVMLTAETVIERDGAMVAALGLELYARYLDVVTEEVVTMIERQAPKRVALRFVERSQTSWDHRKLVAVG
jgi:nitroimidazol reductase NimA-like FMN-containing flavoprotein (pyridoxamine 5'-phosphate oxidase superfamily)